MTGSCTWMLPLLLLPLFISFLQSACVESTNMTEFNRNVDFLGGKVRNCFENCSSSHMDSKCKCFNLSVPQGGNCSAYFIDGLKSLDSSVLNETPIQHLLRYLDYMVLKLKINFCFPGMKYETLISPKNLHVKLELMKQQLNSRG